MKINYEQKLSIVLENDELENLYYELAPFDDLSNPVLNKICKRLGRLINDDRDEIDDDHRLCYVDLPWLYFAKDYENVTGDNWEDKPFNAGKPHSEYGIVKIAISDDVLYWTPTNADSPYSVDDINEGKVRWLSWDGGWIFSGAGLNEVLSLFDGAGVKVYVAKED